MTAIFFFVMRHRDSQIAYNMLMSTQLQFKPFEIKGKNIANQLSQYGITKVPTLYFPDKKAKVEGSEGISRYFGLRNERPVERRSQRPPKREEPAQEEESDYGSLSSDGMDSLQRSLEENPIQSEEEIIKSEEEIMESEESDDTLSDEISLDI